MIYLILLFPTIQLWTKSNYGLIQIAFCSILILFFRFIYLRKTKLKFLPDKTRERLWMEMDTDEAK